ncbi:DUF6083 domain-containing protein [Streptomyces massasporeus]
MRGEEVSAAYPGGDGSSWCRLPHAVICTARDAPPTPPALTGLRRSLAVNTRRLIDAGAFTPCPASPDSASPHPHTPPQRRHHPQTSNPPEVLLRPAAERPTPGPAPAPVTGTDRGRRPTGG